MKLVDMKVTAAERKAREKKMDIHCAPGFGGDKYPYGLQVRLDDAELTKLGIDSLPKVGQTFTLTAKVEVTSTRQNKRVEGADRGVELQIQKLSLEKGGGVEDAVDNAIRDADA